MEVYVATEREQQLAKLLVEACEHIAWALNYARRVAQNQVVVLDTNKLSYLRGFIKRVTMELKQDD